MRRAMAVGNMSPDELERRCWSFVARQEVSVRPAGSSSTCRPLLVGEVLAWQPDHQESTGILERLEKFFVRPTKARMVKFCPPKSPTNIEPGAVTKWFHQGQEKEPDWPRS